MPTYEHAALLQHTDQNGNTHIDYPITKADNVDGFSEAVQAEISDLKKSVSDGKTSVANAITAKGITTATDATFATMATNIGQIETGVDTSDATATASGILSGQTAYVKGNKITGSMVNRGAVTATIGDGESYTIPSGYHNGDGKITASSSGAKLNFFTQTTEPSKKEGIWVKTSNPYRKIIADGRILSDYGVWDNAISDLPYKFFAGSAVVYNGEIHILGGTNNTTNHYKWNGSSWISVSTLPYNFNNGSAVVYDGEIHLLGTASNNYNYQRSHYKWNGSSRISVSTLPYCFYGGSAVVYNGEIHILGGTNNTTNHYKWNGSSWISVSTLPYRFNNGSAVVYNGEIHILGGSNHYKWNGSSWIFLSSLPYQFDRGSAVVYNGEIHLLGGNYNSGLHYKWNGSSWISVSTLPYHFSSGSAVVYNEASIYMLGSNLSDIDEKKRATFYSPAKAYTPYTLIVNRGDTNCGVYATSFADMSAITGTNNRFQSGFDDIYYFGETDFEKVPIYYGNGTQWIKLKN